MLLTVSKRALGLIFPTASSLEKYKAQCIFCHAIKDRQETSEVWRPQGFFCGFSQVISFMANPPKTVVGFSDARRRFNSSALSTLSTLYMLP